MTSSIQRVCVMSVLVPAACKGDTPVLLARFTSASCLSTRYLMMSTWLFSVEVDKGRMC